MLRVAKTALGVAVLGSLLFSGATAFGASARTGGTINVWVTPSNTGRGGGSVVITGVIGDYGKNVKVNAAGKADQSGKFTELVLKKGTILINRTQLNAAIQNAQPTDFNTVTCSGSQTATAPVPIVSGTKAYAGITGSVTITQAAGFIVPLTSSGKCDTSSNANLVAVSSSVTGSGTVSFG